MSCEMWRKRRLIVRGWRLCNGKHGLKDSHLLWTSLFKTLADANTTQISLNMLRTLLRKYLNEFEMFMYVLSCSGKSDEKRTVRGDGVSEDMFYVSVNML